MFGFEILTFKKKPYIQERKFNCSVLISHQRVNFLVGSFNSNLGNLLGMVLVTDTYYLCTNHFFHLYTQPKRLRRFLISLDPVA